MKQQHHDGQTLLNIHKTDTKDNIDDLISVHAYCDAGRRMIEERMRSREDINNGIVADGEDARIDLNHRYVGQTQLNRAKNGLF